MTHTYTQTHADTHIHTAGGLWLTMRVCYFVSTLFVDQQAVFISVPSEVERCNLSGLTEKIPKDNTSSGKK